MSNILKGLHFQVKWGRTRIGFQTVSGLEMETEVIHYREGSTKNHTVEKMPGIKKFGNIKLFRGVESTGIQKMKINTVDVYINSLEI